MGDGGFSSRKFDIVGQNGYQPQVYPVSEDAVGYTSPGTDTDAEVVLETFDIDGSGYVSYAEFAHTVRELWDEAEWDGRHIRAQFKQLDTDGSGRLTAAEMGKGIVLLWKGAEFYMDFVT